MSPLAPLPTSKHHLIQGELRHMRGAIPSRPHWGVPKFHDHHPQYSTMQLPSSVDLSPNCPPILDQGQLGACSAHATAEALWFINKKLGHPVELLSRLYIYYNSRVKIAGEDPANDSGCQLVDVVTSLDDYGACDETLWPYDVNNYADAPPPPTYTAGTAHKLLLSYTLSNIYWVQACLALGYPVVIGFAVPENMESDICAKNGLVQYPTPTEPCMGFHAVMVKGYDLGRRLFKASNSWGQQWGDNGSFYLPFDFWINGLVPDNVTLRIDE